MNRFMAFAKNLFLFSSEKGKVFWQPKYRVGSSNIIAKNPLEIIWRRDQEEDPGLQL